MPVSAYVDWIMNCDDGDTTVGMVNENTGYAAGVKVSRNKRKGDWSAGYKFAYIEANATPGIFNDSDFGGTNRRGHVIGGAYNIADSIIAGAKIFLTEQIQGSSEGDLDTIVQADLIWKF